VSVDPLGPVQITGREIYDEVVRVRTTLERLVDQAAATRETLSNHDEQLRALTAVPERLADHEARLRSLERARWPLPSLAAVTGLAALGVSAAGLIVR